MVSGSYVRLPCRLLSGSACPAASGSQGTCKPLGECPWALDEMRNGRYPKTCPSSETFPTAFPIVCCVGRPVTNSSIAPDVGRIARQSEYSHNTGGLPVVMVSYFYDFKSLTYKLMCHIKIVGLSVDYVFRFRFKKALCQGPY